MVIVGLVQWGRRPHPTGTVLRCPRCSGPLVRIFLEVTSPGEPRNRVPTSSMPRTPQPRVMPVIEVLGAVGRAPQVEVYAAPSSCSPASSPGSCCCSCSTPSWWSPSCDRTSRRHSIRATLGRREGGKSLSERPRVAPSPIAPYGFRPNSRTPTCRLPPIVRVRLSAS